MWSMRIDALVRKRRNIPACTVIRTTAKTMPTIAIAKRSLSKTRFLRAIETMRTRAEFRRSAVLHGGPRREPQGAAAVEQRDVRRSGAKRERDLLLLGELGLE